jgi:translation initiation factor 2B subunit (eIF-2B alpha/beta/delta family)
LDYGQAILEVESAAKVNPEFAQTVQELAASAEEESNPKLAEILQEVVNTLNSQQPTVQNLAKLAEKINNLNQAQTINLTQHNNF